MRKSYDQLKADIQKATTAGTAEQLDLMLKLDIIAAIEKLSETIRVKGR